MQLHLERTAGSNHLSAYGDGYFVVNEARISSSIIISAELLDLEWPVDSVTQLTGENVRTVIAASPELVVLGTGSRHEFPAPEVFAAFDAAKIGLEVMGTGAACRTYNVLLSEGRNAIAMLMKTDTAA